VTADDDDDDYVFGFWGDIPVAFAKQK